MVALIKKLIKSEKTAWFFVMALTVPFIYSACVFVTKLFDKEEIGKLELNEYGDYVSGLLAFLAIPSTYLIYRTFRMQVDIIDQQNKSLVIQQKSLQLNIDGENERQFSHLIVMKLDQFRHTLNSISKDGISDFYQIKQELINGQSQIKWNTPIDDRCDQIRLYMKNFLYGHYRRSIIEKALQILNSTLQLAQKNKIQNRDMYLEMFMDEIDSNIATIFYYFSKYCIGPPGNELMSEYKFFLKIDKKALVEIPFSFSPDKDPTFQSSVSNAVNNNWVDLVDTIVAIIYKQDYKLIDSKQLKLTTRRVANKTLVLLSIRNSNAWSEFDLDQLYLAIYELNHIVRYSRNDRFPFSSFINLISINKDVTIDNEELMGTIEFEIIDND